MFFIPELDTRGGRGVCCDAVHVAKLFTSISTGTLIFFHDEPLFIPASLTLKSPNNVFILLPSRLCTVEHNHKQTYVCTSSSKHNITGK